MKNIMVYFVDNNMYLFYKDKMYMEKLDSITNGIVLDKLKFMEQFNIILKKYKIRSKLFGDDVTIVKTVFYAVSDLFFLEQIFLDLGFTKVHFFDIREIIPEEDATMVEINQDYLVFYFESGLLLPFKYFKDIPKLFSLLDIYFKPTIIIFGTNNIIPKIEYKNKKLYYYENYKTYLTDCLLKVKKCDA